MHDSHWSDIADSLKLSVVEKGGSKELFSQLGCCVFVQQATREVTDVCGMVVALNGTTVCTESGSTPVPPP